VSSLIIRPAVDGFWTPLQILMLFEIYLRPDQPPENLEYPARSEAIHTFLNLGLVEKYEHGYFLTEYGGEFLSQVLTTKLPPAEKETP
jgi:hypothetical protein